jgi:hypothetical protein
VQTPELVALAKAHGICLPLAVCLSSAPRPGAAARRKAFEQSSIEAVPPAGQRCRPHPRRSRAPAVDEPQWLAARYSFASDESCYWPLWWALVSRAQRIGRREQWLPAVRGVRGQPQFYLLELAQLVLDEQANRELFEAAPQLFALCLRVEPATWAVELAPRFRALQAIYGRWLGAGRAMIQRSCAEGADAARVAASEWRPAAAKWRRTANAPALAREAAGVGSLLPRLGL